MRQAAFVTESTQHVCVNEFADLPTSEYVSQYTGYKPNNVWTQFARESYLRDVTYGTQSSQGVQDCTCECPRSQVGYMVRWMRLTPTNKVGIHQGTCWNEHVVNTGTLTPNIMTVASKLSWCETTEHGLYCCCLLQQSSCPGIQGDKPNCVWSDLKLLRTCERPTQGDKPNNVSNGLKHLRTHEHERIWIDRVDQCDCVSASRHSEHSDPWS